MLRKARERHAERLAARDPAAWGISAEILTLPAGADVACVVGNRGKVIGARRSDAFSLLHGAKRYGDDGALKAGISDAHKKAADRYVRDWMQRMGVGGGFEARERADGDAPTRCRTDVMVEAGQRLDDTHRRLGRPSLIVLRALAESLAAGEVRPWRAIVKAVTGESDPTAQVVVVRVACEDLRLVHDEIDGVAPRCDAEARVPVRLWFAE